MQNDNFPAWKAMLGGLIVAGIYIGGMISIFSPFVLGIELYHAHPYAALAMLAIWVLYFLFVSYVFSAYKLLDFRWTTSWVRKLLERKK